MVLAPQTLVEHLHHRCAHPYASPLCVICTTRSLSSRTDSFTNLKQLHREHAEEFQPLLELAGERGARGQFDASAGRAVQHIFVLRGKLLSNAFLFDLALKTACTAAGLVDSQGR